MGASASIANVEADFKEYEDFNMKPPNGSDIQNFEECKKELIELRAKVRKVMDTKKKEEAGGAKVVEALEALMASAKKVECNITPFLMDVSSHCGGKMVMEYFI